MVEGPGVPLGDSLPSASPAEVKLAETTLASIRVRRWHRAGRPRQKPKRVIADKGYDREGLRERLRRRGVPLLAPHRKNRSKSRPEEGRALRRSKRRWTVERTIA